MNEKTFTLERELRLSTCTVTERVEFTVTPGSRKVKLRSAGPQFVLDITDARAHWAFLLGRPPGRVGGGFASGWRQVP